MLLAICPAVGELSGLRRTLADDTPAQAVRLPAPSKEQQDAVLATVKKVLDLTAARTAVQRRELAGKLFAFANESKNPVERFTLLKLTTEWARDGGDLALMLQACELIAAEFDIDPAQTRESLLKGFAKKATDEAAIRGLVERADRVLDQAVAEKRLDAAVSLAEEIVKACASVAGKSFRKQAGDRLSELKRMKQDYVPIATALATLRTNPDDPPACLVYGRHLCLVEGDFAKGLPLVAKGDDAKLREAASADLALTQSPEPANAALLQTADKWFNVASSDESLAGFHARAAHWYALAQPTATGLDKTKIAKRLEEISKVAAATRLLRPTQPPRRTGDPIYLDDWDDAHFVVGWGELGRHGAPAFRPARIPQ